jgi:hypothetical protein
VAGALDYAFSFPKDERKLIKHFVVKNLLSLGPPRRFRIAVIAVLYPA